MTIWWKLPSPHGLSTGASTNCFGAPIEDSVLRRDVILVPQQGWPPRNDRYPGTAAITWMSKRDRLRICQRRWFANSAEQMRVVMAVKQ